MSGDAREKKLELLEPSIKLQLKETMRFLS